MKQSSPDDRQAPALGSADPDQVLNNPHKGWYWHYYDNGIQRYHEGIDKVYADFPGMQTIYIRLPWCELEPAEGDFRWDWIDAVAARHLPLGRTLAFCVSCKETDREYPYATPRWVEEAGAKGQMLSKGDYAVWEPDYEDPVFLEKLGNFHQAFAARYDGEPWVEWIDIGSYGDWGEGHTTASSGREWPVASILRHFEIYQKAYRQAPLQANDDFVGSRTDREGAEALRSYLDAAGFAITDHGVCVDHFARTYGFDTLRDPDWLAAAAGRKPLVLELEHYPTARDLGHWKEGKPFQAAIERTGASFAGFHGYPGPWLKENEAFARRMANRLGYWLFPHGPQVPETLAPGTESEVRLRLENRGTARPYYPVECQLRLVPGKGGETLDFSATADPLAWRPGESVELRLPLALQPQAALGRYAVDLRLVDTRTGRPIALATVEETPERWAFLGWTEVCIG